MNIYQMMAVVLLAACSAPAQIMVEPSSPTKPAWIDQPPTSRSDELLYFVGIKTGTATLEEARNAAINDAMGQVANYIGSEIQSTFEEFSTEVDQKLKLQITSKSIARVVGANAEDWYTVKRSRIDKNFKLDKFDAYVLLSFKKSEMKKELQRRNEEMSAKAISAYDLYRKGIKMEDGNAFSKANQLYGQATALLSEIDSVVELNIGTIKNSNALSQLIEERKKGVIEKMRRVALVVNVNGPEGGSGLFRTHIASELNKKGFTVSTQKPAIEIDSKIRVKESGFVMNNYSYYAEGSVSARRLHDGQQVAVIPLKAKGFHRRADQAALNAISEAANAAGESLVEGLLKLEQEN